MSIKCPMPGSWPDGGVSGVGLGGSGALPGRGRGRARRLRHREARWALRGNGTGPEIGSPGWQCIRRGVGVSARRILRAGRDLRVIVRRLVGGALSEDLPRHLPDLRLAASHRPLRHATARQPKAVLMAGVPAVGASADFAAGLPAPPASVGLPLPGAFNGAAWAALMDGVGGGLEAVATAVFAGEPEGAIAIGCNAGA